MAARTSLKVSGKNPVGRRMGPTGNAYGNDAGTACKGFGRGAAERYLNDLKAGNVDGGAEQKEQYFHRIGMNPDEIIPLKTVESEYIDHLKKQVHYLEVEANYLRNMRKKYNTMRRRARLEKLGLDPNAPENAPENDDDGEQDLAVEKMKQYRRGIADNKQLLVDKDKALSLINQHRQELLSKIDRTKLQHRKDWDALTLAMTEKMKRNDSLRADIARRDREIQASRTEVQRLMGEVDFVGDRLLEARHRLEKSQRDRDRLELQLAEKERLISESSQRKQQLQTDLEDDRTAMTSAEQDLRELREEIARLLYRTHELELAEEMERKLRQHLAAENANTIRENATLQAEVTKEENNLRRRENTRVVVDIEQIGARLKQTLAAEENIQDQQFETDMLKKAIRQEKERKQAAASKLDDSSRLELGHQNRVEAMRDRINTTRDLSADMERKLVDARREKLFLDDQALLLENERRERQDIVKQLKAHVVALETQIRNLLNDDELNMSAQQRHWHKLTLLAQNMRNVSDEMAHHTKESPFQLKSDLVDQLTDIDESDDEEEKEHITYSNAEQQASTGHHRKRDRRKQQPAHER